MVTNIGKYTEGKIFTKATVNRLSQKTKRNAVGVSAFVNQERSSKCAPE